MQGRRRAHYLDCAEHGAGFVSHEDAPATLSPKVFRVVPQHLAGELRGHCAGLIYRRSLQRHFLKSVVVPLEMYDIRAHATAPADC